MHNTKIEYLSFSEWEAKAKTIGWVHCHDNTVVCDDEHDSCIGEFDSELNSGWLLRIEAE